MFVQEALLLLGVDFGLWLQKQKPRQGETVEGMWTSSFWRANQRLMFSERVLNTKAMDWPGFISGTTF